MGSHVTGSRGDASTAIHTTVCNFTGCSTWISWQTCREMTMARTGVSLHCVSCTIEQECMSCPYCVAQMTSYCKKTSRKNCVVTQIDSKILKTHIWNERVAKQQAASSFSSNRRKRDVKRRQITRWQQNPRPTFPPRRQKWDWRGFDGKITCLLRFWKRQVWNYCHKGMKLLLTCWEDRHPCVCIFQAYRPKLEGKRQRNGHESNLHNCKALPTDFMHTKRQWNTTYLEGSGDDFI